MKGASGEGTGAGPSVFAPAACATCRRAAPAPGGPGGWLRCAARDWGARGQLVRPGDRACERYAYGAKACRQAPLGKSASKRFSPK